MECVCLTAKGTAVAMQCHASSFSPGNAGAVGRGGLSCPQGFQRQNGSCVGEWGCWAP